MNNYYTPAPHEPARLSGRNMAMIALGAAGLGIAAGLFAFSSQSESPAPAGYVIVPESGDQQASPQEPESERAPNVAVPPAVSRNGGMIVQVPPQASTGGGGNSTAGNPVTGRQEPGQKTDTGTDQQRDKKKDDTNKDSGEKNKDSGEKKDTDTNKDSGEKKDTDQGPDKKKDDTGQGPDKKKDEPVEPPPDLEGPVKDGDIYTKQPDIFDRPTGPVKGNGGIYQVPPPPPIIIGCATVGDEQC
jgi:hypothetical protein